MTKCYLFRVQVHVGTDSLGQRLEPSIEVHSTLTQIGCFYGNNSIYQSIIKWLHNSGKIPHIPIEIFFFPPWVQAKSLLPLYFILTFTSSTDRKLIHKGCWVSLSTPLSVHFFFVGFVFLYSANAHVVVLKKIFSTITPPQSLTAYSQPLM